MVLQKQKDFFRNPIQMRKGPLNILLMPYEVTFLFQRYRLLSIFSFLKICKLKYLKNLKFFIFWCLLPGGARFAEIFTFFIWTLRNLEFRCHRKWSLNRRFQCKSKKNYRAQTLQNLALTKIWQKFRKTSTSRVKP